jgi:hypothetical protein
MFSVVRESGKGTAEIAAQVVNGLPTIKRPAGTKKAARFGVAGPHDLRNGTRRRWAVMSLNGANHRRWSETVKMGQKAFPKAFQNLPPRNLNFY